MRFLEELNGECTEREDSCVERETQTGDVPVRAIEGEKGFPDESIRRGGCPDHIFSLGAGFEDPVDDSAKDAEAADDSREPKWIVPICIETASQPRRPVGAKRTQARNGEIDAESKADFFAFKPLGQRR